jgi:hypothetical protein
MEIKGIATTLQNLLGASLACSASGEQAAV